MDTQTGRRPSGSRCVALVGPYLSGKTTLLEAILFRTGAIPRQGRVSDKSSVGDAAPEARAHGMSIELNAATTSYLGENYTFLDCPGSVEFAQDQRAALAGADVAVVVCEADDKKAPALQLILKQLDEINLPRILFINKVDKTDSSPRNVLEWLQPASSKPLILRQLPIMKGSIVTGFVDLALERAFVYQEHLESKLIDMPADMAELEKSQRFAMLERLADHDDELMEQLLSDMEPPKDRIFSDLASELADGFITPVLFGSAEHGTGIERLLKALRHEAPGIAETAKRLGLKPNGTTVQVLKTFHTAHGGKLSLSRVLSGEVADGAVLYRRAGAGQSRGGRLHAARLHTGQGAEGRGRRHRGARPSRWRAHRRDAFGQQGQHAAAGEGRHRAGRLWLRHLGCRPQGRGEADQRHRQAGRGRSLAVARAQSRYP